MGIQTHRSPPEAVRSLTYWWLLPGSRIRAARRPGMFCVVRRVGIRRAATVLESHTEGSADTMTGAPLARDHSLGKALIGSWELYFREDRTESGELHPDPSLGADPTGLLVYDSGGRFSAQFMRRDRRASESAAREPPSSGHNNSRAVNGYDAYFGRYTVDEATGLVTQTLDGALAVENVGVVVTRRLQVTGDGLMLRLPTTAVDGTPVVRTLKWRRVA